MITSQTKKVYTVNGQEFTSLEEAQASALAGIITTTPMYVSELNSAALELARALIPHADEIVDILTTRSGSLLRARKTNSKKAPQLPYVKLRDSKAGVEKFLRSYPRNLNLEQTATMSDAVLLRCRGIGKVWLKRIRAMQPEVAQPAYPELPVSKAQREAALMDLGQEVLKIAQEQHSTATP